MNALTALLQRGFSHGIHPDEFKDRTHALPTQRMPFVERYTLPVRQHLGAPARPVVNVGQRVQRGELIAEPGAFVSTALHTPVTGWVRAIGRRRFPGGRYEQAIEVEADRYATQRLGVEPPPHWHSLTLADFVSLIQRSGIVGLGGASLPTHVKYSLRAGVKIKTLIANGAECEPYLTNDHRVMVEQPEALLKGIEILHTLLGAVESIIGIELNKPDAIDILRKRIRPALPGGAPAGQIP